MKRRMKKLASLALILFLLGTVSSSVSAQTPSPDPCDPAAPDSVPCPVKYDITSVSIPRTQSWTSAIAGSINQLLGQQVNAVFNWAGVVRPAGNALGVGSEKLTNYGGQIGQSSSTDLNPAALQDIQIHDQQPKPFTMTSVECVRDPQSGRLVNQFPSSERIETKDIPGLSQAIEGSRQLGSFVTGYTQVTQDYNLKNVVVDLNNVGCDTAPATGETIKPAAVESINQNSYGTGGSAISSIVTTITSAIIAPFQGGYRASLKQTAEIQGKGLTPWIHYALCLFSGCKASDIAPVSYDTDQNKNQLAQAGGAVAAMYKPAAIDDTYKANINAADPSQQWSISGAGTDGAGAIATAVTYGQGRVLAAGDYMNCTLMPADYQSTAVPGGECATDWTGSVCRSESLLPDASTICRLCNKEKIKDMADTKSSVPEGIPPTMEAILTSAGEAYRVPPSSLLAVMYHEGAFSGNRFIGENAWTEANVIKWSTCGQMPNCDEQGITAQSPFGFFPIYFKEFQDAVLIDDPGRKGKTSLCNFMDVAYAAAQLLSRNASASIESRPNITEPMCFKRPMTIRKSPASCTDWDENLVFKSHVYYASYCPQTEIIKQRTLQGLLSKNEVPQDRYEQWVVNWYKAFKCN